MLQANSGVIHVAIMVDGRSWLVVVDDSDRANGDD